MLMILPGDIRYLRVLMKPKNTRHFSWGSKPILQFKT